ncbi:MAG: PQQ-dependent sugar dehydrogenase [Armatimonadota bacterium]|nr:PQQ-dependent sugar dehydrogenase [Armatimonadota bacterium]MDR7461348.1 PQQ-dependent sugar dehydrogenase [Armatimonadota bacterium]MDR7513302.1 PQQ-dependent sugar dehydrogenase [Armatimonadota bacterium]
MRAWLLAFGLLAACNGPVRVGALPALRLERLAEGFQLPVHAAFAGAGGVPLFVVEQAGRVRIWDGGTVRTFLDLSARVESGGEKGLLSLAFHPQYASNRRFFVNYTRREGGQLRSFVSEFRASADLDAADAGSERVLLVVDQPFDNHNGGLVLFGPDGSLYVGMGDGGSADDPLDNAQNPTSRLGKMLRVHPDTAAVEVWASGFRNPWRFSFDRATGRMFLGDVGQDRREEIDVVEQGRNYGWAVMEGSLCNKPEVGCNPAGLTLPIAEYATHVDGTCSVTGGYVYRGNRIPWLVGRYVFGDYCGGQVWALADSGGRWSTELLLRTDLRVASFAEQPDGELLLVDHGGGVYRLVNR